MGDRDPVDWMARQARSIGSDRTVGYEFRRGRRRIDFLMRLLAMAHRATVALIEWNVTHCAMTVGPTFET